MENNLAKEIIDIGQNIKKDELGKYESFSRLYDIVNGIYSNYTKNISEKSSSNLITGDSNHLIDQLIISISKARRIDIIVSFLMESGARLIIPKLKEAVNSGVKIRLLTGSYLRITEPSALYLLKDELGESLDLRMYSIENKSFHPKAYILEYDFGGDIFIGSSNLSHSALTSGIEWNYKIDKIKNEKDFKGFKDEFENLFNNRSRQLDDESLRLYSLNWKRPKIPFDINEEKGKIITYPQPRGAQIEALYELKNSRKEGIDKGLVVAATGIGKTYLAAFDSLNFKKVLFIAHREEILNQAKTTFENIRQNNIFGFFSSKSKDRDCDVLFTSVQTLGKEEYLNECYFKRDEFDYIIIDEFHHAAAGNYMNIINYFTPRFLLGLTATPERLDNKDVFAICDYNLIYEVRLNDAINKGWLVPFRYYGIYDDVDYNKIQYKNGKYNEGQLEKALMINKRAELILNHYKKYNSRRCLAFCSSKNHAEYMAKYFNENRVNSCSVFSGDQANNSIDRKEAISKLNQGEINVIFSVDMFNEGVDVPNVDMVMFLRPTESPTIFLQQLGRGLRKAIGKRYLNVLDFIGNYKKVNLIPFLLSGDFKKIKHVTSNRVLPSEEDYPEDCIIDFDFRLIDIFEKQALEMRNIKSIIYEEYLRVKEMLGHRPTRLELFTYIDDDIYLNMKKRPKLNILNDYLSYLNEIGELSDEESSLINTRAHEFIRLIETTSMTKSYKMPLLLAFYNKGNLKTKLTEDNIYESFYSFYKKGSNATDIIRDKAGKNFKSWSKKDYLKITKNPQDAFINSAGDFFYREGDYYCLVDAIEEFRNNDIFLNNYRDVVDYRNRRFYKERIEKRDL